MNERVLVLVEGVTEEIFVKDIIGPYLFEKRIDLIPTIVTTKSVPAGLDFKGGLVSYEKTRRQILRLLGDTSAVLVTTLFDYYGLRNDFPGRKSPIGRNGRERALFVENALSRDIEDRRFLPHLQVHEFENLLFSSPSAIASCLLPVNAREFQNLCSNLTAIRKRFANPEEINDSYETCASQRIVREMAGYKKTLDGLKIAKDIGLETMRRECPHFHEWMTKLENLPAETST